MGQLSPLSEEQLRILRQEPEVQWQGNDKKPLDTARMQQLLDVLGENTGLKELCIESAVDNDALMLLADWMKGHETLESFRLKRQNITPEVARALTDACFDLPQLNYFQMKKLGLEQEEIRHIAKRAGEHPSLTGICLSQNEIDDTSAQALADAMDKNRHFRFVRLMDCELSDDAMLTLADRAALQPDMIHFHLHYNPVSDPVSQEIPRRVIRGEGVNLISCLPYNDDSQARGMTNSTIVKDLATKLATAETQNRSEDVLTHAQAVLRLPAMKFLTRPVEQWEAAKRYLDHLPTLDTMPDLLATNDRGQCAAENPYTWQNAEALFAEMEQKGETIDEAWLARKTASGESLLLCALTSAAHSVVPALNKRGIQIQGDALLEADGKPNTLLQNMVEQRSCAALFTEQNWQGKRAEAMREVFHALPQNSQHTIRNLFQLSTRLQVSEKAVAVGR
jgi:hypothetical protein